MEWNGSWGEVRRRQRALTLSWGVTAPTWKRPQLFLESRVSCQVGYTVHSHVPIFFFITISMWSGKVYAIAHFHWLFYNWLFRLANVSGNSRLGSISPTEQWQASNYCYTAAINVTKCCTLWPELVFPLVTNCRVVACHGKNHSQSNTK